MVMRKNSLNEALNLQTKEYIVIPGKYDYE